MRLAVLLLIVVFLAPNMAIGQVRGSNQRALSGKGAMAQARMEARVAHGKAMKLGGDKIVNGDSVFHYHFDSTMSVEDRAAILSSSINFQPWLNMGDIALWKPGMIGRLRYPSITVKVSHSHAIVRVVQVISPTEMIGDCYGKLFWFSGIDTSTLADDQERCIIDVFKYDGTKQYTNVSGSTTSAYHLIQTPLTASETALRDKLTKTPPGSKDNIYRKWPLKSGRYHIGRFVSFTKGDVTIEHPRKGEATFDANDLTKDAKKLALKLRTELKKKNRTK